MSIPHLLIIILLLVFTSNTQQQYEKDQESLWKVTETPIRVFCVKHKGNILIYKYKEYQATKKFPHKRIAARCPIDNFLMYKLGGVE